MTTTNLRIKLLDDSRPQYEIARAAGMTPSRLSEYAMGRKKIPMHHVFALVRELNCNPVDIIGEWTGPEMDLTNKEAAG